MEYVASNQQKTEPNKAPAYITKFTCMLQAPNLDILCWNVRGLNSPARHDTVHETVASTLCHIACFQETKLSTIDQFPASYLGGHRLNATTSSPNLQAALMAHVVGYCCFGMITSLTYVILSLGISLSLLRSSCGRMQIPCSSLLYMGHLDVQGSRLFFRS